MIAINKDLTYKYTHYDICLLHLTLLSLIITKERSTYILLSTYLYCYCNQLIAIQLVIE